MNRPVAKIAALLFSTLFINNALAQTQQWECAVNLQQGDTGTMSLSREADKVDGSITIIRNDNNFVSDVNGRWNDNVIELKRLLDANSSEPMSGIVVTLGIKKVKIGGRFSSEFQGVWSADCDLVSSSSVSSNESEKNGEQDNQTSSVPPSITSRVSPSKPSSSDRVTLSARASHPDGIESLNFYVNDKQVHSCDSDACEFNYGRFKKGKYSWYVLANSKSGVSSAKRSNELLVSSKNENTCIFKGIANGPSAKLSLSYRVTLKSIDEKSSYRNATQFNDLEYAFKGVPKGEYTISVDTLDDPSVLLTPTSATIKCGSQTEVRQNFNFS